MNESFESLTVQAVDWQQGVLLLLDQRALPHTEDYLECKSVKDAYQAIKLMVVRGAPAIGITAAYTVVLSAQEHWGPNCSAKKKVLEDIELLRTARPTAVNLMWALDEMRSTIIESPEGSCSIEMLLNRAKQIHQDDIANNMKMGELGLQVFQQNSDNPFSVMTHCNAGGLATGGYGTALGVIRSGWKAGLIDTVFADETRPWLQGSRLTAWELMKDNIPVVLNTDSAASWVMKNKGVAWIVVGADRVAANGDVVNKIGTYALAIQARFHDVKFMVVAPSSTVDMSSLSGEEVDIEMRDIDELLVCNGKRVAASDAEAINPVFDVTPASLVDYLVTEKGVINRPTSEKMKALFKG